ncbi:MAG: tetratricopeptide repeat protein [Verrucomicrobiaceae bacterium]|nr:tetratricopeptide repeat protein [Verrucomicrobiaceae bacterium]
MMRCFLLTFCFATTLAAQQLDLEKMFEERNLGPVTKLLAEGDFELVARIGEAAVQRGLKAAEWRLLRLRALPELGQHETALQESEAALKAFPGHLELLMLRHELARQLGKSEVMADALQQVNAAAKSKAVKERTASEMVALGRAALVLGADAQKVITQYFKAAQSKDAKLEAVWLAEGNLALDKEDAKRAADVFRAGLKAVGETAELRFGLARAFLESDRVKAGENLEKALALNPNHKGSHLMRAEMLLRAEKFLEAEKAVQTVLDADEHHPRAWTLRAVVAHLFHADGKKVEEARAEALRRWSSNPEVDHLLGKCLSRAYRFAESAAHQRKALELDASYLPAKVQLCHDLLRLGDEPAAWKLAAAIRTEDGYNIQAHNLGLLEKQMNGYVTMAHEDFILKMPKRDWPIYGERALVLLREAKAVLAPKYGLKMDKPVLVEFFGEQQDFAIRTFGALGGQGMLGVCFGTVVTMNSPGSLAQGRSNWESTLWHEFCHVITLSVTKNRMPRWLSEGISVYEERQRDPAWGMRMDARFREMALDEEKLTPVSRLSSAFMNAKEHDDLMFAYFESSQVVEYLLEKYGKEKFQRILLSLAEGQRINDAIAAHTADLEQIEAGFTEFITSRARQFGALAEWQVPEQKDLNPFDEGAFETFLKQHPKNLPAIRQHTKSLVEQKNWPEVLKMAEIIVQLLPEDFGSGSGYELKALAFRQMKREDEEAAVLRQIAAKSSDAQSAFLRLIELDRADQRWSEVRTQSLRSLAVNPFLITPQLALAEASSALKDEPTAIAAWERVLVLDPGSAARTHFRLAQLWREKDATKAKRHLLDSLASAPRNREALEMLRGWAAE